MVRHINKVCNVDQFFSSDHCYYRQLKFLLNNKNLGNDLYVVPEEGDI